MDDEENREAGKGAKGEPKQRLIGDPVMMAASPLEMFVAKNITASLPLPFFVAAHEA